MKRKRYQVIVADPPWQHDDALGARGAKANYKTMLVDDIKAMARGPFTNTMLSSPLREVSALALCGKKFRIADDAILFLWRVASMPQAALDVIDAWGFEPKSELVWLKTTGKAEGMATNRADYGRRINEHFLLEDKMHFGMGRYVRNCHETCIIAGRGRAASRIANHSTRSVFYAPAPRGADGKVIHSAKPDEFYEIVEQLTGKARKLELFSRKPRSGWKCVGNEIGVVAT